MKPLRYVSRDRVAYAIVILYVAAVFVIWKICTVSYLDFLTGGFEE